MNLHLREIIEGDGKQGETHFTRVSNNSLKRGSSMDLDLDLDSNSFNA